MSELFNKIKIVFPLYSVIGLFVGLAGGYLYYYFVGCKSGSCGITSNPYLSMAWGLILGYLVGGIFTKKPKSDNSNH